MDSDACPEGCWYEDIACEDRAGDRLVAMCLRCGQAFVLTAIEATGLREAQASR